MLLLLTKEYTRDTRMFNGTKMLPIHPSFILLMHQIPRPKATQPPGHSPSLRKSGQELKQAVEAETMEERCMLACLQGPA